MQSSEQEGKGEWKVMSVESKRIKKELRGRRS
jgi:hypothetical protein